MPRPPVRPVTWTIANYTPSAWGAVITGFGVEYFFEDNTKEMISQYPSNITSGNTASKTGTQIKCIKRAHVVLRVEDQKGTKIFDAWVESADLMDCPDTHTTTLEQKRRSSDSDFDFLYEGIEIDYDLT